MLKAEELIFQRGEDGNLLSYDVVLESIEGKPTVKIRPLTRGKLMEIYYKAKDGTNEEKINADNDVIKEGLVEPKLTEEQLKDVKPLFLSAVSTVIMSASLGISQKDIEDKAKGIMEQEEELKKNS